MSFPPRRSSDLVSNRPKKFTLRSKTATPRSVSQLCTAPCSHWLISAPLMHCTPRPARFYTATANPRRTTITWYAQSAGAPKKRSEEHTSELQSRGHLVCRLLLEKKNAY